jgi:hypothetical protein
MKVIVLGRKKSFPPLLMLSLKMDRNREHLTFLILGNLLGCNFNALALEKREK